MKVKSVSSRDVAREAGVSQATVSYVLNKTKGVKISSKTCNAVHEAVRKLNYHPNIIARSMKLKCAMSVGLVTSRNVTSYAFMKILEGLKDELAEYNYSITLCTGHKSTQNDIQNIAEKADINSETAKIQAQSSGEARTEGTNFIDNDYFKYYESRRIDGVIFLFAEICDEDLKYLDDKKMPYVIINTNNDNADVKGTVSCDLTLGMINAIRHLSECGIARFGYIGNRAGYPDNRKYACFKSIIENNSLRINSGDIYNCRRNESEIIEMLSACKQEFPDAFICDSPSIGFYLLKYFADNKIKVPAGISVVSIGASGYMDYSYPAMSSIEPPLYMMGVKSAKEIISNINGWQPEEREKLNWEFINRKSCLGS